MTAQERLAEDLQHEAFMERLLTRIGPGGNTLRLTEFEQTLLRMYMRERGRRVRAEEKLQEIADPHNPCRTQPSILASIAREPLEEEGS